MKIRGSIGWNRGAGVGLYNLTSFLSSKYLHMTLSNSLGTFGHLKGEQPVPAGLRGEASMCFIKCWAQNTSLQLKVGLRLSPLLSTEPV